MRVLVGGPIGYVGAALTRFLAARGHEVVTLKREGAVTPRVVKQLELDQDTLGAVSVISDAVERCDAEVQAAAQTL
jgi:nucleoside-diphosphate-sugar epimerase